MNVVSIAVSKFSAIEFKDLPEAIRSKILAKKPAFVPKGYRALAY